MVVGEVATEAQLIVVGGGPGGYPAAIRAAQKGLDVVLVERDALGGVCLNVGCIPSKALISAADHFHRIPLEAQRGIVAENVRLDFARMQEWKQGVVQRLTQGVNQLLTGNGVHVVRGTATFTGPNRLVVENGGERNTYVFEQAIIATGSRPATLPDLPFDGERILDSTAALALREIPQHLLVIGGGYIGLELGTVFAKLGSRVTVVELTDQLLPGTDPDLVRVMERRLRQLGVEVHLGTRVREVETLPTKLRVTLAREGALPPGEEASEPETLEVDKILVTVGRRPNSEHLGLDRAGVKVDERGYIPVDEQRRTNVPHIFAVGDVAGEPLLAHKATREGIVAAEAAAGLPVAFDPAAIPAVIFTDPEIAYVGMTETEAQRAGYQTLIGQFPFQASGRALTTGEPVGFVKTVADASSHLLLGVQIVGPDASTLISEATLALEMAARLEDLALTIHSHPTLPETLMEAADLALGQPIHILRPAARKQSRT